MQNIPYAELPLGFKRKLDSLNPIYHSQNQRFGSIYADIYEVNKRTNKFRYFPDKFGDVWKVPEQFKRDGGGDCEDFAIAKYHQLARHPEVSDCAILVCEDRKSHEFHAVCVIEAHNKRYVLDNKHDALLSFESFICLYRPIYSADYSGVLVHTGETLTMKETYNA